MAIDPLQHLFLSDIRAAEYRSDKMMEAVIGIVVDNKDPEKLSRVKVSFPFLPGDDTSHWAQISALGAGNNRGWYFLPEIDDEVLVMFAHGDMHRPVVLGQLWNGKHEPPDKNDGNNERRTIVSREGSRIVFDDDKGTITLEDGGQNGTITISKENKITIESSTGDVCIQSPAGEMSIVANEVKLKGSMNFHFESLEGINLGSGGAMEIKGGVMLKVTGEKIELNPGGVSSPAEAQESCEDVADPLE